MVVGKPDDQKFTRDEVDYWPRNPRAKMVRWYGLQVLRHSLSDVILTSLLGARVDGRLQQAHLGLVGEPARRDGDAEDRAYFDYDTDENRDEFWFDYVADTGEGWNPTYAIAVGVAHDLLLDLFTQNCELRPLRPPSRAPAGARLLKAGGVLIMGGDEIYPSASHIEYERKLLRPYIAAAVTRRGRPDDVRHLFALPGNHDWYDGLVAFCGIFLQQRRFGRWQTRQRRSYFALRLPHDWWLVAVDVPHDRPIDELQKQWLQTLARQISAASGDRTPRLVVCLAEPVWRAHPDARRTMQHNLLYLEGALLAPHGANIHLRLSGDYHHYEKHVSHEHGHAIHNIICGGGGAFLHPTHGIPADCRLGTADLRREAAFPSEQDSRRIARRLLVYGSLNVFARNFALFLVMGALYGVLAFTYVDGGWSAYMLWLLIAALGFLLIAAADTGPRLWLRFLLLAGPNLLVAFVLTRALLGCFLGDPFVVRPCVPDYTRDYVAHQFWLWPGQVACMNFGGQLLYALCVGAIGMLTSSLLTAIYMFCYLRLRGAHWNEAFSLLQHEGYKSFLRLRIARDGLDAHVLGLTEVPRDWAFRAANTITDAAPAAAVGPAEGPERLAAAGPADAGVIAPTPAPAVGPVTDAAASAIVDDTGEGRLFDADANRLRFRLVDKFTIR